jgi:hypothetical protein
MGMTTNRHTTAFITPKWKNTCSKKYQAFIDKPSFIYTTTKALKNPLFAFFLYFDNLFPRLPTPALGAIISTDKIIKHLLF